jgi:hypothetical protein
MAKTLFEMLSGGMSPDEQRQKTKEESESRREFNRQEGVQKKRLHSALDMIGLAPGVGEPADLLNMALYGLEGKPKEAAISGAAMVPGLGVAAIAGKKFPNLFKLEWYEQTLDYMKNVVNAEGYGNKEVKNIINNAHKRLTTYLKGEGKKNRPKRILRSANAPNKGVAERQIRRQDELSLELAQKELRSASVQDKSLNNILKMTDEKIAKGEFVPKPVKKNVAKKRDVRSDSFSRVGGSWHRRQ